MVSSDYNFPPNCFKIVSATCIFCYVFRLFFVGRRGRCRLRRLGLASGDARVIIPLQTYKRIFDPTPGISVKVAVEDLNDLDAAQEEISGLVRLYRGLDPLEDDNFSVNRQEQFRQLFQTLRVTTYGVGLFLTALSLLVGGIGVMNIMFVSVKERTREIGVRKALGATRRAVLIQFLIEAVVICLVGGVIGVGLAGLVAVGINQVFTAQLTLGTVLVAFTICAATGLLFGLAPAWQAAKARPVEALRYE
ncbi:MAG TPA: FtsX-like permease family protein [Bacteroidetes bacterium]|nr:FtsX-like permease family protein [Bacteroidota bacterium]